MLQAVIELQGLEVSSISFERPNTVTIFGTPKPIWHFSRNQCHYRSTVHNDILGCLVKTFCTRLATNDQYCQEHYKKSRDDYRSRRKPRGQELRERLAYINQPMVRPTVYFTAIDSCGKPLMVTLNLKSMESKPTESQKDHLEDLELRYV